MCEGAGEGKKDIKRQKSRDDFGRAGIGVDDDGRRQAGRLLEVFDERSPRLSAMEGDGALKFGGQIELDEEELILVGITAG